MIDEIHAAIERRILRGAEKVDRWLRIRDTLSNPAYIRVLTAFGFKPDLLANMNIYVAEKIIKMCGAYLGICRIDPYSLAIVKNAIYVQRVLRRHLTNKQMVQSLTANEACGLPHLRHGSVSTAATQAASTRKALAALNVIEERGAPEGAAIVLKADHPLVAPELSALPEC